MAHDAPERYLIMLEFIDDDKNNPICVVETIAIPEAVRRVVHALLNNDSTIGFYIPTPLYVAGSEPTWSKIMAGANIAHYREALEEATIAFVTEALTKEA